MNFALTAAPEVATTVLGGILYPQEAASLSMSPAAIALPPPAPNESSELSRPATPMGRKKQGSELSDAAKANVRMAVRDILDKGHDDDDEYFCLITGLSNYEHALDYAHIVPGATASSVSLLFDTWCILLTGL